MEYQRLPTFYITFMDCNNTSTEYTICMEMQAGSTADDAKRYFLSSRPNTHRILVLSIWDADWIDGLYPRYIQFVPPEVRRYLGEPDTPDFSPDGTEDTTYERPHDIVDEPQDWDVFQQGAPPPDLTGYDDEDDDDPDAGEEWKKLQ